jgi:hypothetical protein
MSDITYITAFYDIGRDKWNNTFKTNVIEYLNAFEVICRYNYNIIIFIDSRYINELQTRLDKFNCNRYIIVSIDLQWLTNNIWIWKYIDDIKQIMKSDYYRNIFSDKIKNSIPENTHPEYVAITNSKNELVNWAINNSYIKTNYVCWIDFGYYRKNYINNNEYWPSSEISLSKFDLNKINLMVGAYPQESDKNILEWIKNPQVRVMAYFFLLPAKLSSTFVDITQQWIRNFISMNIIDDEQEIWLQAALDKPELFKLHNTDGRWHTALKEFSE